MDDLNIYYGTSGVANFISPSEKWIYNSKEFMRHDVPDWVFGAVMYQIFPKDLETEMTILHLKMLYLGKANQQD